MTTIEAVLNHHNRDAGLTIPRALPKAWKDMDATERKTALWYIHNVTSYMDKAAVARHVIGTEILANESAGISPVMTEDRANNLWNWVFNRPDLQK